MKNYAQVKIQGGKLLQLEKFKDNYKITGDFFAHPEEIIEEIEKNLSKLDKSKTANIELEQIFKENLIVGFALSDLINLYQEINE